MCVCVCVCVYVYLCVYMHVYIYVCICICVYVYIYVYVYEYVCAYFRAVGCRQIDELSVAAKTSLTFLTMRGSASIKRLLIRSLNLTDHARPALFKQGYLLITIGEKP